MQLGVCTSIEQSAAARAAGWDFVEENVQQLLQGTTPDVAWTGAARAAVSALPVPAANCLVPASIKITGPTADTRQLHDYMAAVLARAAKLGMKTLVFGSGGARDVPAETDRHTAHAQIVAFARAGAEIARGHGVTIVCEPLNRGECNVINSVAEALAYVKAVNHPNFQCLVDSYHFWLEDEPLENLREAMPWIKHVHVADRDGRVGPGKSGTSDYRPFFRVLREGGYDGLISVEAPGFDPVADGPRTIEFLKDQWRNAV